MGRASGAVSAARPEPQSPIATQAPSPPQTSTASLPPRAAAQSAGSTQAEKPALPSPVVVILDPAHGGADNGAHGGPGDEDVIEKDLVLAIAQTMRREMERQGVRVVLTRQGDASVSLDERAALANGFGPSFFVSLHVASAGEANTAQAYSFGTPLGAAPPFSLPRAAGTGAVRWEDAQAAYLVPSRRLAELVQVELAQKLRGSPDVPQFAQVRQLRIVAHPAVAIELSSVAEENAGSLEKTAVPLANALMRAIAAYRQPSEVRP
ncbi:MAG TPA: N-acetylmuramoyl-L-alanine amidase [Candidatus Acidoferrales bacterium]|nr:N-acetylmuramoyl-L-alanine amidase [Candidatus Acidoferrales bacterium]